MSMNGGNMYPAKEGKPEIYYSVKAQRGGELRCKGWKQETILRMLENNMENAEIPEQLVIYGGNGKCARNWESYHAIVQSLKDLEDNETLVIQSGMPVAVFRTHKLAPRVVMATTNIMKADWERFYDLQDKNLTIFAQYTAAPWEYIGTQGVIEGTFETLSAIALKKEWDNDMHGKIFLTAGAGGMGGNQTWAGKMHGAVVILVDADESILRKMSQSPSVLSETQQMFMKRLLLRTSFRTLLQKCVLAMTRFPISHQDTQELRLINSEAKTEKLTLKQHVRQCSVSYAP